MDHAEVGVLTKENAQKNIRRNFAPKLYLTKTAIHTIFVQIPEYDTTVMMVTRLTILMFYLTVQCSYSY